MVREYGIEIYTIRPFINKKKPRHIYQTSRSILNHYVTNQDMGKYYIGEGIRLILELEVNRPSYSIFFEPEIEL